MNGQESRPPSGSMPARGGSSAAAATVDASRSRSGPWCSHTRPTWTTPRFGHPLADLLIEQDLGSPAPPDMPGGAVMGELDARVDNVVDGLRGHRVRFKPFADAGADGRAYRVWIATGHRLAVALPVRRGGRGPQPRDDSPRIGDRRGAVVVRDDLRRHRPRRGPVRRRGGGAGRDWTTRLRARLDVGQRRLVRRPGHRAQLEIRPSLGATWQPLGDLPGYPPRPRPTRPGSSAERRSSWSSTRRSPPWASGSSGRESFGEYPPGRYATCAVLAAFER